MVRSAAASANGILVGSGTSTVTAGDVDGAVTVYTEDIEHDDVGMPGGPVTGKAAARKFYQHLTANFRTEDGETSHRYFDGKLCSSSSA